ncbi:MAG: hypothetical protein PUC86_01335 [Solobacterium sp.]|nr:hypothetical protein [Solobacterium sp.]MDY2730751.1 hypothetical protein [Erysipelotrichaceae bacterium]MCI7732428.1 hypothetical protein [Solobacterium sp.]MDD5842200.1 hypothetical protein [Solobacterium sp.]MDD5982284.1 hypothetical protein [Solobacterium sp.]
MKYLIIPSTVIIIMLCCTYLGYRTGFLTWGIILGGIFSLMYMLGCVLKK